MLWKRKDQKERRKKATFIVGLSDCCLAFENRIINGMYSGMSPPDESPVPLAPSRQGSIGRLEDYYQVLPRRAIFQDQDEGQMLFQKSSHLDTSSFMQKLSPIINALGQHSLNIKKDLASNIHQLILLSLDKYGSVYLSKNWSVQEISPASYPNHTVHHKALGHCLCRWCMIIRPESESVIELGNWESSNYQLAQRY
ncbi:hypothetical protein P175DRAFT_0557616 [Aspergillus ochraceoroseus IBT 24754]|uniref:Uncharacterized protein n=1 Tax=Aspergillus ochraceoroseus IBT 24754 TaxID=1392256 RepID=A0A2T5LXC2_9EURO|nr:uncharacterized protein P175DRAFT_0557616 [Aspergillus ochraceoroseus IBT 24754]PTU20929.1 hypothetical protein P175DRAFT_0557616 [Aspergillus ochraceoroseus IBT 24754]